MRKIERDPIIASAEFLQHCFAQCVAQGRFIAAILSATGADFIIPSIKARPSRR
jgi:hypothetical protein